MPLDMIIRAPVPVRYTVIDRARHVCLLSVRRRASAGQYLGRGYHRPELRDIPTDRQSGNSTRNIIVGSSTLICPGAGGRREDEAGNSRCQISGPVGVCVTCRVARYRQISSYRPSSDRNTHHTVHTHSPQILPHPCQSPSVGRSLLEPVGYAKQQKPQLNHG